MNSVLEYAKLYASLGWKVFPVNKRKRPAVKWTTECTTDIKKIEDWYRKNPHLGVGIACGPSNLFVLDIDIKKDEDGNIKHNGFIELERLLDQHGSLPDTLIFFRLNLGLYDLFFVWFKTEPVQIHDRRFHFKGEIIEGV